jgi:hypothetical protein
MLVFHACRCMIVLLLLQHALDRWVPPCMRLLQRDLSWVTLLALEMEAAAGVQYSSLHDFPAS